MYRIIDYIGEGTVEFDTLDKAIDYLLFTAYVLFQRGSIKNHSGLVMLEVIDGEWQQVWASKEIGYYD